MLFSSQTKTSYIVLFVLTLHLSIPFFFTKKTSPSYTPPKAIAIKEIRIKEKESSSISPLPTPISISQKKESVSSKVSKKKESPKKKEVATKKPEKNSHKEVTALLQKSLSPSKEYKGSEGKKEISLASEGFSWKGSFEEELVLYLQNQLSVPEPGVITLQLSLNAQGTLISMQIMRCEAAPNRLYLEKALPTLLYPSFTEYFPKEKERRFSLTFHVE